jgi:glycerophosphoryl diester phosphodiesterase
MDAWPYPRWIAHRGAGKLAPENTLAAFRLGAQHGYRMFECDVKLSADEVPFLLHDSTLQRTTDARGTASDRTWSELSRLDAGRWHSRTYAGEPLPSFETIAQYCIANGFFLNVEIKPTPGDEANTGTVAARRAARLWHGQAVAPLLSSFQPPSLQAAMAAEPQLPRALLLDSPWEGWFDAARSLQCVGIVCNYALWTPELVAQVHGAGMRCLSYTVNDEWAAQRLIALGTDGIITDRVDLFPPA